jgi:hypothetical protein
LRDGGMHRRPCESTVYIDRWVHSERALELSRLAVSVSIDRSDAVE